MRNALRGVLERSPPAGGNRGRSAGVRGSVVEKGARVFARVLVWLAFGALLGAGAPASSEPPQTRLWLWAWERPEDLRFLAGRSDVGVAYLARTVVVAGDGVTVRPRRQPLRVAEATVLTAVVRIEVLRGLAPAPATLDAVVHEAALALEGTRARRLQLDFDARTSEIPYYRELLTRLRPLLPRDVRLGITALAAWCADGRSWLASSPLPPVDDVVPMVFSMGGDSARVRAWLGARGGFTVDACRRDFGVSVAEPVVPPETSLVVHAFSPTAWTPSLFRRAAGIASVAPLTSVESERFQSPSQESAPR